MIIGLILACHAAVFVTIYFGRIRSVVLCGSDIILFAIPFVVATVAYAAVYAKMIRVQNMWTRRLLVAVASLATCAISTEIGMVIAFNSWGI